MGCSASFAKIILFIFNIVIFLVGIASLSVGIWVHVSRSTLFSFVNLLDAKLVETDNREKIESVANQSGLIAMAAIVLIVVGVITFVVGFCGCCGAIKESPMLLNFFAILVAVCLIVQITAAILAGIFQAGVKSSASDGFVRLQNKYYVPLDQYISQPKTSKAAVTYFINWLQVSLGCCGASVNGSITSGSSWANSNGTWKGKKLERPITCCQMKDWESKVEVQRPEFNWTLIDSKLLDPSCPFTPNSDKIYLQACPDTLISFIGSYSVPIIVACVIFALIEFLGIVIACCLIKSLRNE